MKKIKKKISKGKIKKIPTTERFEKMFKDIQIHPAKNDTPDFFGNEQPTWIISDNNSTFKSFINYG